MTPVKPSTDRRLAALRRFALAITILNIVGHTVLGFEQSWAQPLVALAVAYAVELLCEVTSAWSERRPLRFLNKGPIGFVNFLLPAHITGLAVSMFLYANDRLWPIVFAATAAIASKTLFRAPIGNGVRHFFNPSNIGITLTLVLFSWVGVAPPYQFTENLDRVGDWLLPAIIIVTGSYLNAKFTRRIPLIIAWLAGFILQAIVRSVVFGAPIVAGLVPLTGVVFILYTFYMITDPATTPNSRSGQIVFGLGVAITYGVLMSVHIVFGLFFALTIVGALRGMCLYLQAWANARANKLSLGEPVVVSDKL